MLPVLHLRIATMLPVLYQNGARTVPVRCQYSYATLTILVQWSPFGAHAALLWNIGLRLLGGLWSPWLAQLGCAQVSRSNQRNTHKHECLRGNSQSTCRGVFASPPEQIPPVLCAPPHPLRPPPLPLAQPIPPFLLFPLPLVPTPPPATLPLSLPPPDLRSQGGRTGVGEVA